MFMQSDQATNKVVLDKRLDDMGWGLLLLLTGVTFLMPGWAVSANIWLLGFGLILLGINGIRRLNGIEMHGFSIALGLLALVGGLAGFLGLELPLFALFLVLAGASIVLKPLFEKAS